MAWPVFPVGFFGTRFAGGNQSADTIQALAQAMLLGGQTTSPTAGGTLTINGESLGSYDYLIKKGSQTISSFAASDWFTSTEDTRSSWIVVDGDLTINSGQTVIPSVRKLFTVLYVRGNLAVNGSISMTARGANHSGSGNSGGSTTAAAIRIINGTYSGVTNPQVPPSGGGGGSGTSSGLGGDGSAGSSGGAGGGGGGAGGNGGTGGNGASATSFSAGAGGGAGNAGAGVAATANGGRGGDAGGTAQGGAGAGNPGGTSKNIGYTGTGTIDPESGTGGVLFIFCTGAISGSGSIIANGSRGGAGGTGPACGGGSGGGSITVLYSSGTPPTITANGGSGNNGNSSPSSGGSGGAGTARALVL